MSENEQDLRDEQDRRGYADVRPKEKQYREPPIKPTTTTITHEPSPRHPVRLPPPPSQQVPIDIDKPSIDNIPKKKSQEKQAQIKQQQQQQQQQLRYQSDPIVENHHQSYPQPQPNLSTSSTGYNTSSSQAYPPSSVLKPSTSYGPIYATPSSLAPPVAPVQPYVQQQQQQVPYPPRKPSYSASDETKPDPKQCSAYDMSILLDRMSRMEDEMADLKAEVRELRREKDIMMAPKMQPSRSDADYQPMMRRRESMGRFPQDRLYYNKSADHHTSARYRSMDYIDDYHPHPRQELYYPYDSPSFYNNPTPPKDDIKSSRPHRRNRSRSFGNVQDPEFDFKYPSQYYIKQGYY